MNKSARAKPASTSPAKPANENIPTDQDALALDALAKAVLAREFLPRTASVRRLAEGVLDLQGELKKARKKAKKVAKAPKKKNKKLAKIPGQQKGR
jgi:hypothetical protein